MLSFSAPPAPGSAPRWPRLTWVEGIALPLGGAMLVSLPVFVQAPWVRLSPLTALLFSFVLLGLGVWQKGQTGALLVGFSGSWLAGCLFWGWLRLHPLWHLPVEAFALPLALAGLWGPWRRAGQFYLGALLGTACTDAAMALCGLMPLWPAVLQASPDEAGALLAAAASRALAPEHLLVLGCFATAMLVLASWLWGRGPGARLVAACLACTLVVDGLFLALALVSPQLSGLV